MTTCKQNLTVEECSKILFIYTDAAVSDKAVSDKAVQAILYLCDKARAADKLVKFFEQIESNLDGYASHSLRKEYEQLLSEHFTLKQK